MTEFNRLRLGISLDSTALCLMIGVKKDTYYSYVAERLPVPERRLKRMRQINNALKKFKLEPLTKGKKK